MSLVDEVLAEHVQSTATAPVWGHCQRCWALGEPDAKFPCQYFRLATELQAAREVVEAAREEREVRRERSTVRDGDATAFWLLKHARAITKLNEALERYDEGRTE